MKRLFLLLPLLVFLYAGCASVLPVSDVPYGFVAHITVDYDPDHYFQQEFTSILSGFLMDNGYVMTAGHILKRGIILKNITAEFLSEPGVKYPLALVAADVSREMAVLRFIGARPAMRGVMFADSRLVKKNDKLLSIGSTAGFPFMQALGTVRNPAYRDHTKGTHIRLTHDAFSLTGNSGCPLLNERGEVVGMSVIGVRRSLGSELMQYVIAVRASEMKEWVATVY